MRTINPNKVRIHTTALEVGGRRFGSLIRIAELTGGRYSVIMKGKGYTGEKARWFAKPKYDPKFMGIDADAR